MQNTSALLFGAIASYVFAAIIGVPALVLLRRRQWQSLGKYLKVGTGAGAACGLIMGTMWGFESYKWGSVFAGLALFALHGFVVSLAYWVIANWLATGPGPSSLGNAVASSQSASDA